MKNRIIFTILIFSLILSFDIYAQSAYELLNQGRNAYLNYNFDEASRLYSQAKKKAKAEDEDFAEMYDTYSHQLSLAKNFLERVEKIVIIDSISVPKNDFFKAYRLPVSSGILSDDSGLPLRVGSNVDYVFTNEQENYKLWSQRDSTGYFRIMESGLLTDGRWSEPVDISDEIAGDSNAVYPFMMADGVTLYYADNGDNSIGGYDIMVASRDAADGSFLQPSNLGFPYNSPYDDYLLAIDELNGIGWWATDRNILDDELTIYVFLVNDLRDNYAPDEDDIIDFARITDYIATQPEDADYDNLLATINNIDYTTVKKRPEFTLAASKGRIFHRYDELPNANAKAAMKRYISAKTEFEKSESQLNTLRKKYNETHSDAIGARIQKEEKGVERQRIELAKLLNEVYKELGDRN